VPCCHGKLGLLKDQVSIRDRTFAVKATATRPKITITGGRRGVHDRALSKIINDGIFQHGQPAVRWRMWREGDGRADVYPVG
jgi:hypothetical protein